LFAEDYLLVDFKSLLRKAPDRGFSATKVCDPVADKKTDGLIGDWDISTGGDIG
jgi:hypothetical protein